MGQRHEPDSRGWQASLLTQLLSIIAPVFGVIAVGFAAVRIGLLGEVGVRRLVVFVFNAAVPTLLFYRIGTIDFPDQIAWRFLLGYYASAFLAYGLGMLSARVLFDRPIGEQSIHGLGAGFSNTVLLGIPLLVSAFGDEATVPVFLIICFHSATLLPVSILFLEAGRRKAGQGTELRVIRLILEVLANPIIVGILLGLGVNLLGLYLPEPIDALASLMSTLAIPCALLALGASLAGFRLQGQVAAASVLAAIKLVVQPVIAWIIVVPILGVGAPWAPVAIVMAGLPSGAMVYLFGARYETGSEVAASVVVLSSSASIVTLSVLLALMGA
ncbi:MAG: AEC family transporter [Gemmatimonadota bacterium]|nr:AEC family transporter [Gemmatimonadota bacterium]MDE3007396.1 AEC family transporter [Gemmatimonadota bacterium]MDE3012656.1 AEC family transporter [Gemmatimonadota bacterium]